jgi:hypothetical protein
MLYLVIGGVKTASVIGLDMEGMSIPSKNFSAIAVRIQVAIRCARIHPSRPEAGFYAQRAVRRQISANSSAAARNGCFAFVLNTSTEQGLFDNIFRQ